MVWDPDAERVKPEKKYPADEQKKPTVTERIISYLKRQHRWVGLTELQERIHASSTRSRLQDIMAAERMKPESERRIFERKIPGVNTGAKEYRWREPAGQQKLFDIPPERRW